MRADNTWYADRLLHPTTPRPVRGRCSAEGQWLPELVLPARHTDWVRDVAWSPMPKLADSVVATCSQVRLAKVLCELHWAQKLTSA
jgi:hypothetical protein